MTFRSFRDLIRADLEHFGLAKTIYDVLLRVVNRVLLFKIFKGVKICAVDPEHLQNKPAFEWRLLDRATLEMLSSNPDNDISEDFLASALEKGDECYGFLDGPTLASYGWYSNQPTETSDGLMLHFSPEYVYMYKGFTHPKYRGQRLHAIGMNLALREYLDRGFRGLVSYIESNNFSSLNSVYRIGYQDFGRIAVCKIFGRLWIHASPGCRALGFFFQRATDRPRPAATADRREAVTVD